LCCVVGRATRSHNPPPHDVVGVALADGERVTVELERAAR